MNSLVTHLKKQEFVRMVFYKMDPKGDECPIKLLDLTFKMVCDGLNQLKQMLLRKGIKLR